MKTIKNYIIEHRTFILFLFIFSFILTLKNKIGIANSWDDFVFHPDTPFWIFIYAFFIFALTDLINKKAYINTSEQVPSLKTYLKYFGLSFICYLIIINVFGLLLAFAFNTFSRNYQSSFQITYRLFDQIIDFIIFGGFSLAYLYSKENTKYRKRLNDYKIINSKSKIQQLKTQLNPHFLFNNLNILDQLIFENQDKASDFLGHFSELYRYTLSNSNKELIPLKDELQFIESYFELMETKYQGSYQLDISEGIKNLDTIVPPFCLQVLIENAIFHNLGTLKDPILITITNDNGIGVRNNLVKHSKKKRSNGVALKNLSEQFRLLIDSNILIKETEDYFTVTLPMIKNKRQ